MPQTSQHVTGYGDMPNDKQTTMVSRATPSSLVSKDHQMSKVRRPNVMVYALNIDKTTEKYQDSSTGRREGSLYNTDEWTQVTRR